MRSNERTLEICYTTDKHVLYYVNENVKSKDYILRDGSNKVLSKGEPLKVIAARDKLKERIKRDYESI